MFLAGVSLDASATPITLEYGSEVDLNAVVWEMAPAVSRSGERSAPEWDRANSQESINTSAFGY
jgi:hypothetical protein